jgi:outer membrane receptor protein involved in Fe transport
LATPLISDTPETYEEKAIFADGVYHFTDAWDIQAGIRYSRNEQTTGSVSVVDVPIQPVFGPSITYPPALSNDSSVTWAVAPTYHISPDLMGYLRVATGYRPGGPNTVVGDIPVTYRPDTVVNYEAGLKGFGWGHAVSFDLALFEIDWKNIQLQDTDAATQIAFNTNGGRARSRGLESALSWKPIGGLTIDANATILDATLRDPLPTLATANGLVGAAGDRLPASAKFSANLGVQEDFPLSAAVSAFVGANWSFVGARYGQFLNVAATAPRLEMPSYSDVDLRAGFTIHSSWHVNLFARNVANGKGVITADNRNGTADSRPEYMTGFTEVQFLQPRTVGFSVAKTF